MDCEICGKRADSLFLISLEGTKMEVCEQCTRFGLTIKEIRPEPIKMQTTINTEIENEDEPELIDNYGTVIRKARETLGLKQEQLAMKVSETASVIRKLETQKMNPTDRTAKRLEKLLKIKLYQTNKSE